MNADLTLNKKILGWEPQVSLEKGLTKTYKWIEGTLEKKYKIVNLLQKYW